MYLDLDVIDTEKANGTNIHTDICSLYVVCTIKTVCHRQDPPLEHRISHVLTEK